MYIKTNYIFLIIFLLSLFVSLSLILDNNKNEKTINSSALIKKLEIQEVDIKKIDIKEKNEQFSNEKLSLEIETINDNILYGSSLNSEFITLGLWNYNLDNNTFNYYTYNFNNRVWSYFIEDEFIYYITLERDTDNFLFKWKLIKSNLNFSDQNVIDEGIIYNDSDIPFFRRDDISKNIILHTVKDNIEFDSNFKITKYLSEYKISIFKNNLFETLIKGNGNHIKKSGNFSYNAYTNLNFYNNNIIYCNVSYYDKETIKIFNLINNNEKILYENKDLNTWSLSLVRCNKENCILSFDNKKDTDKNKLVNLTLNKNNINIIYSNGKKRPELLKNNIFIIFANDYFTLFKANKNKFMKKIDLETETFVNFITDNNDKVIIKDRNSEFYIMELK